MYYYATWTLSSPIVNPKPQNLAEPLEKFFGFLKRKEPCRAPFQEATAKGTDKNYLLKELLREPQSSDDLSGAVGRRQTSASNNDPLRRSS